ncbi:MAG: hypothetical protein M3406_14615 [Chloroflexota bacterium]|nr:hypothetical protein [Chloroflexota bacterium]
MTMRRQAEIPASPDTTEPTSSPLARRRIEASARPAKPSSSFGTLSREEAEANYVAARDAWVVAMRGANSGRPADLATLAIAQEAYEAASMEVEQWRSGARIAIPIQTEAERSGIRVAVGQELEWRRVLHQEEKQPGPIGRLVRRLTGRG